MAFFDNPVIPGFSPDPSICRAGDDYYVATSSFEYVPGVPIWHSRDLVHWRLIGHALDRPSQLELPDTAPSSTGVYAPTLRYHDGRFWLITTVVAGAGNILVTAEDPAGPWSDPVPIGVPGIDPDLAWEEDGTCWCVFSSDGIRGVRIDPKSGELLGEPAPMWSGSGLQYPEGPHLYRVGDWWYLLLSEGGTERGHALSLARARALPGPFEPHPANPVLSHRSTGHPVQNTGHGDLVQAHDGTWWMVLLGTRPRGDTPMYHGMGRETFLAPVRWEDEWPLPGPLELRAQAPALAPHPWPQEPDRDDFDSPALAPCWVSLRRHAPDAARLDERPGHLVLHARGDSLDKPGALFVGRRQRHADCTARTAADVAEGGRGGLTVRLDEAHHYEVEVGDGMVRAVARIGPLRHAIAEQAVLSGPLTLRIDVTTSDILPPTVTARGTGPDATPPPGLRVGGPDTLRLGYETDSGNFEILAELDGRYLTTEVAGGFTGRVFGMYATRGSVAFDWFELRSA
ncbi:glycoside hydrolase family 43 protein [Streptomyces sp. PSKA30]|uniref:glycoside hydrolase family 43 protein n=1 Tax=Streptomyces sp. PSKA30 TaxID=2874597 RepID=UPI001CD18905|nr:glycoside hydrolase family 43 protein [Streptomyces sp. PSKA30]MBZ9645848.1 glycoside hydrolase family 43 protein [Streptomyces sp. PSKA30]